MVEQGFHKAKVTGSTPVVGTSNFIHLLSFLYLTGHPLNSSFISELPVVLQKYVIHRKNIKKQVL